MVNETQNSVTTPQEDQQGAYSIKVLQKSLGVLEALLEARSPLSSRQICARTGLPKATAFRIITNLLRSGYLVETNDGYWLGLKLLQLGALVEENLDLKQQALPFLDELLDRFNETVHLATLDTEFRVVYVDKRTPRRAVGVMISRVGLAVPIHCTALGKAMAAFRSEEEIRRLIRASGLKAYTPSTITDKRAFLRELGEIRSRGYAVDEGEHEIGVRCVAAPIRDKSGVVAAGVSVSVPDMRMSDPAIGSPIAIEVMETANRISRALGHLDDLTKSPLTVSAENE